MHSTRMHTSVQKSNVSQDISPCETCLSPVAGTKMLELQQQQKNTLSFRSASWLNRRIQSAPRGCVSDGVRHRKKDAENRAKHIVQLCRFEDSAKWRTVCQQTQGKNQPRTVLTAVGQNTRSEQMLRASRRRHGRQSANRPKTVTCPAKLSERILLIMLNTSMRRQSSTARHRLIISWKVGTRK